MAEQRHGYMAVGCSCHVAWSMEWARVADLDRGGDIVSIAVENGWGAARSSLGHV